MKVGLGSYSYHLAFGKHGFKPESPLTLKQFIYRVKELGLDGFQIDPWHLESRDEKYLKEIRKISEEMGLYVELGACGTKPQYLKPMLNAADILGVKVLRTFIGAARYSERNPLRRQMEIAVTDLKKLSLIAKEYGIKIAVENHGDLTSSELLQIIKEVHSPHIGVCFDTGFPLAVFEDPVSAAKRLIPYTLTTHFKDCEVLLTDYGMKIRGTALGKGVIDLRSILQIIKKCAPGVNLNIEMTIEACANGRESLEYEDRCIRESVEYLKKILAESKEEG